MQNSSHIFCFIYSNINQITIISLIKENIKLKKELKYLTSALKKSKFLRTENNNLKRKLKRLNSKSYKHEILKMFLKNIFTPKQIEKILHPFIKKVMWGIKDISEVIALRSICPEA